MADEPIKRPPGRPPLDPSTRTPSADVHLTLPASEYDKADRLRQRNRETLQDLIRRGLRKLIDDERGGI
jgi:hypothetical protein